MKANKASSAESARHPYLKRGFYLSNRFWHESPIYSHKTKDELDAKVETFYHPNALILNLINPI